MNVSLKLKRRHTLQALAFAAAMSAGGVFAQAWPTKPISLIVPFPAGGTTDVLARALADKLQQSLGQPVIVESRPGAGATLGADYVAKSNPDGYTLLVGAVHHTIASSVYKKLPYDFQKDLVPVTTIALVPNVLVVNAANPARTVAELVAQAKAAPGQLNYGSNGNGTAQHLIGTQFENVTGTDLVHIPYKGSGPLVTDLLGNQITMSFDTVTPVLQHIKSGKLRALAVTTAKRSSALPDVPTLEESGLKGFDIGKVARMSDAALEKLLLDPGIIRNRMKIWSARNNAQAALRVIQEFGSLDKYFWSFVGAKPLRNRWAGRRPET